MNSNPGRSSSLPIGPLSHEIKCSAILITSTIGTVAYSILTQAAISVHLPSLLPNKVHSCRICAVNRRETLATQRMVGHKCGLGCPANNLATVSTPLWNLARQAASDCLKGRAPRCVIRFPSAPARLFDLCFQRRAKRMSVLQLRGANAKVAQN
jgi:hypothetical protein